MGNQWSGDRRAKLVRSRSMNRVSQRDYLHAKAAGGKTERTGFLDVISQSRQSRNGGVITV